MATKSEGRILRLETISHTRLKALDRDRHQGSYRLGLGAEGIDGGPPRECMACHLGDDLP